MHPEDCHSSEGLRFQIDCRGWSTVRRHRSALRRETTDKHVESGLFACLESGSNPLISTQNPPGNDSRRIFLKKINSYICDQAGVALMAEHLFRNQGVAGSTPVSGSFYFIDLLI